MPLYDAAGGLAYPRPPLPVSSHSRRLFPDANVLPNPGSRVVLSNPKSPFINANLVPGFANKSYIATQGPTPNTLEDFWCAAGGAGVRAPPG